MFENLRAHILGKYSKYDKELLAHIEKLYREFVNNEEDAFLKSFIPEQLSSNNKSEREFKADCLETSHWGNQIGDGALKTICTETINYILNKQEERFNNLQSQAKQRLLFAKQLNDPISLLFQSIKTWLARKISVLNCADDNLCSEAKEGIDKYIDFLDAFLSQRSVNLFNAITHSSSDFHKIKRNIQTVILKLGAIRELIEVAQNNVSSLELFRSLYNAMEHTTTAGIKYIYYVLQSHETLKAFEFQRIVTPQSTDEAVLQTRNGMLLKMLFSTPIFANLYNAVIPQPIPAIETSSSSQLILHNRALSIPSVNLMLAEITKKPLKFNGITGRLNSPDMQKNHDMFIQKLIQFAYFRELVNVFVEAAGIGGDIIAYGGAVQVISILFNQFTDLINELGETHTLIDDTAKTYYIEILGDKDPPNIWLNNYDKSRSHSKEFSKKIDHCRKNAAKIKAAAESFKISEATKRLLKLKEELQQRSVAFLTNRGVEFARLNLGLTLPRTRAITTSELSFSDLMARTDESLMCEVDFLENEPGNPGNSMKLLDIILSRNPKHYEAREKRIELANDSKNFEKAIQDYNWFLDPTNSCVIQAEYEPDAIISFHYARAVAYYNWAISLANLNDRREKLSKSQENVLSIIDKDGAYSNESTQLLHKINMQIKTIADHQPPAPTNAKFLNSAFC